MSASRRLPGPLRLFVVLSSVFLLLSLFRALAPPPLGFAGHGIPVLWPPSPGFDFYDYLSRMTHRGQPDFFSLPGYAWYYAPAGAPAYGFFYLFCHGTDWYPGFAVFVLCLVLGLGIASYLLGACMQRFGIQPGAVWLFLALSLITSWPIYISLQRGNLESVLWFFLAAALWLARKDRWLVSGLLLGLAAAFKIYPVLCFGLFLPARKWKELGAGLLTMAAVTLASLRYLQPDIRFAAKHVLQGMQLWTHDYARVTSPGQRLFDHSFFEVLKELLRQHAPSINQYLLIAGLLSAAFFFARVLHLPRANQVVFLLVACVALPPASFDYALQNLYIAWAWLVADIVSSARRDLPRWSFAAMALFAAIQAPLHFLSFRFVPVGGVVKGVALLALMALAVAVPFNFQPDLTPRES